MSSSSFYLGPTTNTSTSKTKVNTLVELCRACVGAHIDRFPPEALGILDEGEWDEVVKLRHRNTKPTLGEGGLDGTGRLHPTVSEKVLLQIEKSNPHLGVSDVTDELLWKDIVEYKYRRGGLSRPKGLYYPWDVLVGKIKDAGDALTAFVLGDESAESAALSGTDVLKEVPMNVILLQETGIGKSVKKFLKKARKPDAAEIVKDFLTIGLSFNDDDEPEKINDILDTILQRWMDMAHQSGVEMNNNDSCKSNGRIPEHENNDRFLKIAQCCHSWRDLYKQIKKFDDDRRTKQGERMRERRNKLDSMRPKIVKVKIKKHVIEEKRLAASSSAGSAAKANSKMQKIRKEAGLSAMRQRPGSGFGSSQGVRNNFSTSVAIAAATKPKSLKRKGTSGKPASRTVSLGDGKVMRIPDMNRSGNVEMQKRMKMLKKNNASFR